MNFEFIKNEFTGLTVVKPKVFNDDRGYFFESYKLSDFSSASIDDAFEQDNHSFSVQGVVRGLHFQTGEHQQSKLVRCLRGEIYDCVVDLRQSSKTFGKVFGIHLSDQNKVMLYVPKGFAHGFSVLSKEAEVSYKVSGKYDPKSEGGIRFDDPDLNIDWKVQRPIVSEKDKILPFFKALGSIF